MVFFWFKVWLGVCLVAGFACDASAKRLFVDDFSYPDGDLASQDSWSIHSGAGGVGGPALVSDGRLQLRPDEADEDVSVVLPIQATGSIYAAFDLLINSAPNQTVPPTYVAHFLDDDNDSFVRTRMFLSPLLEEGTSLIRFDAYGLGIGDTRSSPDETTGPLEFGRTYRVLIEYNIDDDQSFLWVDPESESSGFISTPDGPLTSFVPGRFAFRQERRTGGIDGVFIDNLVIATTFEAALVPEPSGLAVLALLLFGGIWTTWRGRSRCA